jgi:hypothetical protein
MKAESPLHRKVHGVVWGETVGNTGHAVRWPSTLPVGNTGYAVRWPPTLLVGKVLRE